MLFSRLPASKVSKFSRTVNSLGKVTNRQVESFLFCIKQGILLNMTTVSFLVNVISRITQL